MDLDDEELKATRLLNGSDKNVACMEEDMRYFIQDIDILINNIINMQERTATGIVAVKEPLILKIYSFLNDYKRLQKENEELLEVKISASAHNRIMELEKENKLLLNSKIGVDLSFDDYISKSLVKEKLKEYKQKIEKYYELKNQGKETDVEFYENITNIETVRVLEELLEEK